LTVALPASKVTLALQRRGVEIAARPFRAAREERLDRASTTVRLALAALLFGLSLEARAQAPAGDGMARPASEAERGATLFRSSCGFCHGADARGAQGPNLTTSAFFAAEDRGRALGEFLKVGRPATGMPPFPTLDADDVADMHAFVRSQKAAAPARARLQPDSILIGDAAAGRAWFQGVGGCAACHSATGDLKGVGARYDALTLQGRIVNPRVVGAGRPGVKPARPARVKVTLPGGNVVEGDLVQQSDFFVTLIDGAGVRRTIPRDNERPKVEVNDPVDAHRQMMLRWTDKALHDVTAYLASLK
jgi:mono/diheme cytochrome c family protein